MDNRSDDTTKEVLKATGGISLLAAEGGDEDIRLRGFSLQQTGDVCVDGLRDPAFYERDQRSGTIRFAAANLQSGGVVPSLATFGPNTVFTRGTHLKIQDLDSLYAQSDFSGKFDALGFRHELQAGVDFAQEDRVVYAARSAAQGGVVPVKPTMTVGGMTTDNWVNESSRVLYEANRFKSRSCGLYVQDLVQVARHWKVLAGLREDNLTRDYAANAIPNNAAGPVTTTSYCMKVSELSTRIGVLYQPTPLASFHFGAANSFNTSGEAYSLSTANVNTPPEQAINIKFGTKIDSADRQWTTRYAVFCSTKLHERNTDPWST